MIVNNNRKITHESSSGLSFVFSTVSLNHKQSNCLSQIDNDRLVVSKHHVLTRSIVTVMFVGMLAFIRDFSFFSNWLRFSHVDVSKLDFSFSIDSLKSLKKHLFMLLLQGESYQFFEIRMFRLFIQKMQIIQQELNFQRHMRYFGIKYYPSSDSHMLFQSLESKFQQ